MTKSYFAATAMVAILAAAPAVAQQSTSPGAAPYSKPGATGQTGAPGQMGQRGADARFIDQVVRDNRAEVELGQMAQQKAASPQVKSLGQRLATDHGKANQQLTQLAQKEGVQVPSGVDAEHSNLKARLSKLNGAAFDRAFVDAQVKDHQKDISFYQRESSQLESPQLRSFAQQSLPVLQQHLQMAQQAQSGMGASGSSQSPHSPAATSTKSTR